MNTSSAPPTPVPAPEATLYRSGAVARMLRMPVSTLRVWERRYQLSAVALTPSGQRLYAADDVRRLALIKQLVDLGHAISRLAGLGMAQLQAVAATHAQTLVSMQASLPPLPAPATALPQGTPPAPWRLAVVGGALKTRLLRATVQRRLGRPMALLGPFDSLVQAQAALAPQPPDAWLVHLPALALGSLPGWERPVTDGSAPTRAVLFRFGSSADCEALAAAGVALLREPQPDAALGQWLCHVGQPPPASVAASAQAAAPWQAPHLSPPPPQRRWSDAALADFAGLSTTIACECPSHVAELLVQLSHFEAYSAECQHRGPSDAALHAYLRQVAAQSRALFEEALERLALHEGLILPASGP